MIEKRFTSEIIDTELFHIENITDNLNAKTYSKTDDVVDLMNKLWEQTQRFEKSNQELLDENEQLKQQLSDIDGQLVMLDNCDNWDYDRMKYTVREIAGIIGYNGTINPKR